MPNPDRQGLELTAQEAEPLRQLRGIRYGQLVVQIHDACIAQIEGTDRIHTDARSPEAARTG